ncbi:hypothetical protein Aduo_015161 [Ancylostoma duodenale]
MLLRLALLFLAVRTALSRGRYEFIEDADLPAFYRMRSAQLAQRAAHPPVAADPYYSYYTQYAPYYQPALAAPALEQPAPAPLYGAPVAAATPHFAPYDPYAAYGNQVYAPVIPPQPVYGDHLRPIHQVAPNSATAKAKSKKV